MPGICRSGGDDAYRLAYKDTDCLLGDKLRPVRLLLELLKPELILKEHNIENTIIIFGSARVPEPVVAQKQSADAEPSARENPADESLARTARIARNSLWKKCNNSS